MNNLEKLNSIFMEIFSVKEQDLNDDFKNTSVDGWDSIHHLSLVTAIEEAFDIMLDPEDILAFTTYATIKQILNDKYEISL